MRDGPLTPDTKVIDLWTLAEHRVPGLTARLGGAELLGREERERFARLRRQASRRRFLGGRLLARIALGSRAELPLDAWRFTTGRHGRPEPSPDHGGLRFNLSHTPGLIVCVVTRGRACGVDVERVPFDADKARFVTAYLDTTGRPTPYRAPDTTGRPTPYRAPDADGDPSERWVLTEAYLKGLGVGLSGGPGGLEFRGLAPGRFAVTDRRRPATGARWQLQLLRPSPHHLLAVATEGGGTIHRHEPAWSEPVSNSRPTTPTS
ncbi:4-phosphopantetheinyl transferase [Streptomyces sp. SID13726]|uniref:4'-phosphopantetheinyl transferase family protein n=1 Tax=Streptomyces sp. SID13726 TaxID=2706058 RepID=UPI0013B85632|nr:4-phosphopantetheinyl transferase [Streptomyces sp. SID13726]NEB03413.1 4-phosphopantetheinyl transferase [Streptomyces sp. SID13726]